MPRRILPNTFSMFFFNDKVHGAVAPLSAHLIV